MHCLCIALGTFGRREIREYLTTPTRHQQRCCPKAEVIWKEIKVEVSTRKLACGGPELP